MGDPPTTSNDCCAFLFHRFRATVTILMFVTFHWSRDIRSMDAVVIAGSTESTYLSVLLIFLNSRPM